MESGDKLKAIELFRKANRAPDAAQLLACMAEDLSQRHANPLRAKKLQVRQDDIKSKERYGSRASFPPGEQWLNLLLVLHGPV